MSGEVRRVGSDAYVLRPCREITLGGVINVVAGGAIAVCASATDGPLPVRVFVGVVGACLVLQGVSMLISKLRVDEEGLRDVRWYGVRVVPWGRVVAIDLHSERWWLRTLDGAAPHHAQVVIQPGRLLTSFALRSRHHDVALRKQRLLSEFLERSRTGARASRAPGAPRP